jgi:hypothetical protein
VWLLQLVPICGKKRADKVIGSSNIDGETSALKVTHLNSTSVRIAVDFNLGRQIVPFKSMGDKSLDRLIGITVKMNLQSATIFPVQGTMLNRLITQWT